MARFVLHVSWIQKQAHAEEVMGHAREQREREVDGTLRASSQRTRFTEMMALIKQITALLDARQERLVEKDSQHLKSERTD